jgi:hypothetical protein
MKTPQSPTDFWRDYEAETGDAVLAVALGQYLRGWAEYPWPLWGLLIATDSGFRFHHFPNEGWIGAMARTARGADSPKEKTIYIPKASIISVGYTAEKSWWKRLFSAHQPVLRICYLNVDGAECELFAEAAKDAAPVASALNSILNTQGEING